jgi:hypothetical protein
MFSRRVNSMARMGFAAALCAALGACLSPTLPVPPPEPQALQEPLAKLQPGGKSIEVEGRDAVKRAIVSLWNDDTQDGILVRADDTGTYRATLQVDVSCRRPKNHIQLWQVTEEGVTSEVKTYRLPNTLGDVMLPPDDAGPCADAGDLPDAGAPADADAGAD